MEQANTTRYVKGDFITVPNKNAIKPLKATTQAVFMWIASYADDEGQCYPSRRTIANNCGISLDTVDIHIKKLVEAGLLVKTVRKVGKENKTNIYQILLVGVAVKLGGGVAVKTTLGSRKNPTENYTTELNHKYIVANATEQHLEVKEFNNKESISNLLKDESRDIKILGYYFIRKGIVFSSQKELSQAIAVNRSMIKAFTKKNGMHPFDGIPSEKILKAMDYAKEKFPDWSLKVIMERCFEIGK